MQIEFRLPSLGADMESATLTQWLKKVGDSVHRGEAIAVVETEKGLIDIESFDDGIVTELIVVPGTKVSVGAVLAKLSGEASAGATAPQLSIVTSQAPIVAAAVSAAPPTQAPQPTPIVVQSPQRMAASFEAVSAKETPTRLHISPAARRRAYELGVDLAKLDQRAPGGIVHIEDVERLAEQAKPPPADARDTMRVAIGNAMARAKREIPHYYLGESVDFGTPRAWLQRYNAQRPVAERLLDGILIAKAVALAAARLEGFNGYFHDGRFERSAAVHVGTAIAVRGGGLVAPALLDADRKDLQTLMREFSDLVARVRAGHMRSGEFTAATITVTSLGEEGVDILYPIINPPQVAIIGTGRVVEKPWVQEGTVAVRPVLTLALAADHRVTDGRAGSRFLRAIVDLLATPDKL